MLLFVVERTDLFTPHRVPLVHLENQEKQAQGVRRERRVFVEILVLRDSEVIQVKLDQQVHQEPEEILDLL
jgi:hypothetical protein